MISIRQLSQKLPNQLVMAFFNSKLYVVVNVMSSLMGKIPHSSQRFCAVLVKYSLFTIDTVLKDSRVTHVKFACPLMSHCACHYHYGDLVACWQL